MSKEEKRAWILLVCAVAAYATYLALVLTQVRGGDLTSVAYGVPLLATVGGSIVLSILLDIFVGGRPEPKDQRDREISRFGDAMGQAFVIIGAVAAMLLAIADLDAFWIANVVYLCFVLSAVLGSVAKITAYRSGMPAKW
ncbi:MAG TPA: hypothetical protein VGO65_04885 [Pseudolysinimonas sp.]|jgi:hypothetical protein|nr:hypothetical protein [Schumannella sp.]HEV7741733.1 hypothetical protein [Pseudolysinimonas sp.]